MIPSTSQSPLRVRQVGGQWLSEKEVSELVGSPETTLEVPDLSSYKDLRSHLRAGRSESYRPYPTPPKCTEVALQKPTEVGSVTSYPCGGVGVGRGRTRSQ